MRCLDCMNMRYRGNIDGKYACKLDVMEKIYDTQEDIPKFVTETCSAFDDASKKPEGE